jgi:hypothetical protein
MRALTHSVAAFLVATMLTSGVAGFSHCCDHGAAAAGIELHHHCMHRKDMDALPVARVLSTSGCHCRSCPSAVRGKISNQVPQIVSPAASVRPHDAKPSRSLVPAARIRFHDDPPPEESSVRRATLCTFLI